MSKAFEFQSPDLDYVNFVLNTTDEAGNPVSQTYKLIYEYRAIKRAEESMGVDLKDHRQWSKIKSSMMPELIHAGLAKFHPEVTVEYLTDTLNPSVQGALQDAIFELLFPGLIEKTVKAIEEKEAAVTSPNAASEASVVA